MVIIQGSSKQATASLDPARVGPTVESAYRRSLAAFVDALQQCCPAEPALAAFFRLNAAYYLRVYLPPDAYTRLVIEAASSLGQPGETPTCRPLQGRTPSPHRLRHDLLRLVEERGDGLALLRAQHALEALPALDRRRGSALLSAAIGRIEAIPADGALVRQLNTAHVEWLDRWAVRNERPARQGEIRGWAHCLSRLGPLATLRQALASGLRFDALLDALVLAAALRTGEQPGATTLRDLCAAHAVRRICELSGTPRLGPWLGLAARLQGPRDAAAFAGDGWVAAEPRALALRALQIGSPLAVQAAEAVLVEAESLATEERDLLLVALAAGLDALKAGEEPNESTSGVER